MTDPHDRRDDLASGLLDGTLPDEAAAAARRDPAVVARVAELAAARDQLRQMPPHDPVARDRAVAAALAAFDPAGERDRFADLAAARHRRAARATRWLGAAAAAVAVVAAVAGLAVMASDGTDEDQATSSVSEDAGDQEASRESADESTGDGGAGEDSGAASRAPEATLSVEGYLGTFDDGAALVDRVAADLRSGSSADLDAPDAPESLVPPSGVGCPEASLPPAAQRAGAWLGGTATVAGTPVDVWLVPDPDAGGGLRIVAVTPACDAVVDQPLG
jgi:hypothetical protein